MATSSPSVVPTTIMLSTPSLVPSTIPSTVSSQTQDIITTIAGTGTGSYSGDNGAATSATLNGIRGVAVDASGRIL